MDFEGDKMNLEKRHYSVIDVLRLPFKISPLSLILHFILYFTEALVESFALAMATAYFVDIAMLIFETEKPFELIYIPFLLLLIVFGIISVMGSILELINARIKYALESQLAPALLEVQAKLDYKYIESGKYWELIERVSDEMSETFLDGIHAYGIIIQSIVSMIAVIGLIVMQIWWLSFLILLFCIPIFMVSFWAGKKNYAAKVETRKYERRYSYYSDEVLTNREAVEERTLFNYTEDVTKRYYRDFELARNIQLKVHRKTLMTMKLTSISLILVTLLLAYIFIAPLSERNISTGIFIGIITALLSIADNIGWQLQFATKNISEAREYMDELTILVSLDTVEGAEDLPDKNPLIFESLEFINVKFKYPNSDDYILNNLSFKLKSGLHYAFVGANGAGKTTITKLLTRLYEEYEGTILINGKDLKTYPLSTIKAMFSVIYQDFSRYQIPFADNIALGDIANPTDEKQLLDVIDKIGLTTMIEQLPHGINTTLGRIKLESLELSTGQWQRIAIARSLLSHAPIKILDEPTSALDPLAENQLYKEFEQLMQGKTTLFISHRLGSTMLADEILVLSNGTVIERGTHKQLLNANGLYTQMYNSQREWYE